MKCFYQTVMALLLMGLSGCATTTFRVTSNPPGARVSLRHAKPTYGFPIAETPTWEPQGSTPCVVVMRSTIFDASGPSPALLVTLNTNQHRIVELRPLPAIVNVLGPALVLSSFPTAIIVGLGSGDMVMVVAVGGAMLVGGVMCIYDNVHNPRQEQDVHVDFNCVNQQPSQASQVIDAESEP
jgi:hypothetical protein